MWILWFLILLGVLIFVHELGHFIFAKKLGVRILKFSLGLGPKLIGKKIGDTEYVISAIPFGGYVKPLGEEIDEEIKDEDKPFAFNYQPVWKRTLIIIAGPLFNLILAYLIFVSVLSLNVPIYIPDVKAISTEIGEVKEGSSAEKAGLKAGDKIISVNGRAVDAWDEMSLIIMKNPGKEIKITVKRSEQNIDFRIIPDSYQVKNQNSNGIIIGKIDVGSKIKSYKSVIKINNLSEAPFKGLEALYETSYMILQVIKGLFTGSISFKTMGGPIMIANVAATAASLGVMSYIMMMALISVNLGVLNLLPIPVLDGGHLLFLSIEAVRRKPLSKKTMMNAQRIGLTALLALILLVSYNDTIKIIVPWVKEIFVK